MFATPALAAAEWANPGPPVQAYEAPTLMIGHVAADLAAAEERPVQGYVHDGAPGIGREFLGGRREVGGCIVDQHPGQPEPFLGDVEGVRHGRRVADVAYDGRHVGTDRLDCLTTGGKVAVAAAGYDDRRSQAGELDGYGPAEPRATTRDEHGVAVERAVGQGAGAEWRRGGKTRQVVVDHVSSPCTGEVGLRSVQPGTRRSRRCG